MKKILFLYNEKSGDHVGGKIFESTTDQLDDLIEKKAIQWETLEDLFESLQVYQCIIIAGGDGTISSVLKKLPQDSPPVAIFPLGTGNDLARETVFIDYWKYGVSRPSIISLTTMPVKEIDIWGIYDPVNDSMLNSFVNYLSIGYSAHVMRSFAKLREEGNSIVGKGKFFNRLGYIWLSLCHLKQFLSSKVVLSHSGNQASVAVGPARCLLFANISAILGIGNNPYNSSPYDTKLEAFSLHSIIDYIF